MTTQSSNTTFVHPELKSGEIFFTNSDSGRFQSMQWNTKRKGEIAYDGEGRLTHNEDWFPVFIQEKELEVSGEDLKEVRRKF